MDISNHDIALLQYTVFISHRFTFHLYCVLPLHDWFLRKNGTIERFIILLLIIKRKWEYFLVLTVGSLGWDSAVATATRCGLDGPGIKSRWGQDFPQTSRLDLGSIQPPAQWVPGFFPGGKAAGAWRYQSPPSSGEVKERVERRVCPYFLSVPS